MNDFFKKNIGQHVLAILTILIVGVIYFYPVLSGHDVKMGDVDNGAAQATLGKFYEEQTGEVALWSPSSFLGMPSYMIYLPAETMFVKHLFWGGFRFFGLGLGGFLILALGFYCLLNAFRINPWLCAGGGLLFAFSTYFIVVLSAGHFNKVFAAGAFPFFFAGLVHLVAGRKWVGLFTTSFGFAWAVYANHPQITYYYSWILGTYLIFEGWKAYKGGEIKSYFQKLLPAVPLVILGVFVVFQTLFNTYHYSKVSTRGTNDIEVSGAPQKGLDLDYITQWSYGIEETFNLIIPSFKGGGSQAIGNRPELADVPAQLRQNVAGSSLYWGDQPFTAGPAYMGVISFLLFVLGMVFLRTKWKWWLLGLSILSIMLAWGKNFMPLTEFFVNYFPVYGKFRAVTMIHVVVQFIFPLVGIMFLHGLLNGTIRLEEQKFKKWAIGILSFFLIIYFGGSSLFSFLSQNEVAGLNQQAQGNPQMISVIEQFKSALKTVRLSIFKSDVLRSFFFVFVSLGLLWGFLKQKLTGKVLGIALLSLAVIDLFTVDKRFLGTEKNDQGEFVQFEKKPGDIRVPFAANGQDFQILQSEIKENPELNNVIAQVQLNDDERVHPESRTLLFQKQMQTLSLHTHYRVLNLAANPFSNASTSQYHKSVGGYHGAKLKKVQNLIDFQLSALSPTSPILNSMNVKYIMTPQGLQVNSNNYGPAWMVHRLEKVNSNKAEVEGLSRTDLRSTALVSNTKKLQNQYDSTRSIALDYFSPDTLKYAVSSGEKGFAVLSEMYYADGWKASFNGTEVPIHQVNYWMRGVEIPQGKGELVLTFLPKSYHPVRTITLISNILFVLILLFLGYKSFLNPVVPNPKPE